MNNQTTIANKIKESYCEKPFTKFDELKALDKKVKRPAKIFAYIFGALGTLALGIVVGCLGILIRKYAIFILPCRKKGKKIQCFRIAHNSPW